MRTALLIIALLLTSTAHAGWETYDAEGRYVGRFDGDSTIQASAGQLREVLLHYSLPGYVGLLAQFQKIEFFESTDCSGSGYHEPTALAYPVNKFYMIGEVYYEHTPTVAGTIEAGSYSIYGVCNSTSFSMDYVDPIALDPQPGWVEPFEFRHIEVVDPGAPIAAVCSMDLNGDGAVGFDDLGDMHACVLGFGPCIYDSGNAVCPGS